MARKRLRHWKQRWNPEAKFVFLKRLRLGLDPKKPNVIPGDPVPTGDVRLGRARLKRWWHAGIIGIADWRDPDELKREKRATEREEITDAVEQILTLLPATEKRLAEIAAESDAEHGDEIANLTRDLEDMRAVLVKAKALGISIEVEAELEDAAGLTAAADGLLDPVEPPAEEAPESPQETPEPEGDAVEAEAQEAPEETPPADEILVEPTGGGWFAVTVPGETEPRKVQGEKKLEELLAELGVTE